MPKSMNVLPERMARSGLLDMPQIPRYVYTRSFEDEVADRGGDTLLTMLRHMMVVREFESMLHAVRSTGEYQGIHCVYRGPAHLSVGQEASAVGAAHALSPADHIYGNHRSHGEFIAKGLAAIEQLEVSELQNIMASHDNGALLSIVERHLPASDRNLAEHFLLFGFLSEILMRGCGFNRGMSGSMHAFFPPFGAYPNNAIVGGSAGIATGAALNLRRGKDAIAVSITGDGSTGCGPVWEAMNFASMAQIELLWRDYPDRGLPVLFFFNNNFYAMGGQTIGETMSWDQLARVAAGVNPDALFAETVDGTHPLAVADAVQRQRERLLSGSGPCLLDVECYRYSGHSTSDANVYRSREELKAWQDHDPIERYTNLLVESSVATVKDCENLTQSVKETIKRILAAASQPDVAPIVDIPANPVLIGELMFNHEEQRLGDEPDPSIDLTACARLRQNAKKSRVGIDDAGQPLSAMRAITLRDALFEAIVHHMLRDDSLLIYGEECREWGGAFGVYRGLADLFGHERVFNSPISEAAIVATAVGYAIEGGRALVELMYADFIGRAGDEIFNQMAKWQAMSGGQLSLPIVLRCSVGSKYGAQHSQDWTSLVAHIPGLKVLYPATPRDAKGLMATALASNDPVVFFESQRLYDVTETLSEDGVPGEYYRLAAGDPDVKRVGSDVTILTIGPCLYPALDASEQLERESGISTEVIDARSLVPFNYAPVLASVKKTGRLAVVTEACTRGSFAMTLAANVTQFGFDDLIAPPHVIGAPNWIVPGAEMESTYFPSTADIVDVVTGALCNKQTISSDRVRRWDNQSLARKGL